MNSVFPHTERRIRLGIWGLGRGLHIIKTAAACNIDVVAGCDFNPHFRELFEKEIPEGKCTADAEEFLSWDFDAVLLATFLPAHGPDAVRCLKAGKHVLSEVTAFFTPAEGVELVEAVEASGKVYQLAENYPYTRENRFLAKLWKEGVFGELMYSEYAYIHDCLEYAYTYIDGTPIEPGDQVHSWRSWLPWHYYCTHSLGPVMAITGTRPVRVTSLPGRVQLPGHLMQAPDALSGMAPSLIEMDNGGLVRNLMGGCTNDDNFQLINGTRGATEWVHGKLHLRLGGRGHSPMMEVRPDGGELDQLAASTGHGGGDFWTLYHFANEILHGVKPPFDVYAATDVTLPGILAYRSACAGGEPQTIPDFRDPAVRDAYREDTATPAVYDTRSGLFPKQADRSVTTQFAGVMKRLLSCADKWQAFASWQKVCAFAEEPGKIDTLATEVIKSLDAIRTVIGEAQAIIAHAPESDGARVLQSQLDRIDLDLLLSVDAPLRIESMREEVIVARRKRHLAVQFPQLYMMRPHLDDLPEVSLPDGYTIRCAGPGDEDAENWCRIISAAFEEDKELKDWRASMIERYDYAPERILFVCGPDGKPVATAAAYGGLIEGYVHYVAVLPESTGKGLGYQVSLAVLHQFRDRGCARAVLHTDLPRLPAIKTYWKLGFVPCIRHESHLDRWEQAATQLHLPKLLEAQIGA